MPQIFLWLSLLLSDYACFLDGATELHQQGRTAALTVQLRYQAAQENRKLPLAVKIERAGLAHISAYLYHWHGVRLTAV